MAAKDVQYVVVFDLGRGKTRDSQPLSYNQALAVMNGSKNPTDVKVYQPTTEAANVIAQAQAAPKEKESEREELARKMGWKFNY